MKTLAPALAVAGGLVLAGAGPSAAVAQETGTFTMTQGGNQVATESFTRTADRLETALEITGQGIMATEAALGGGATVQRLELRILPPGDPDAEPMQTTAAEFEGDTIRFEQPIGQAAGVMAAAPGTVPYVNPSPSYMEQIVRRARAMGGNEVTVQVWMPAGGGQVVPAHVAFEGNSATLALGNATIEMETDADGRLLAGEIPAQGLVIERE